MPGAGMLQGAVNPWQGTVKEQPKRGVNPLALLALQALNPGPQRVTEAALPDMSGAIGLSSDNYIKMYDAAMRRNEANAALANAALTANEALAQKSVENEMARRQMALAAGNALRQDKQATERTEIDRMQAESGAKINTANAEHLEWLESQPKHLAAGTYERSDGTRFTIAPPPKAPMTAEERELFELSKREKEAMIAQHNANTERIKSGSTINSVKGITEKGKFWSDNWNKIVDETDKQMGVAPGLRLSDDKRAERNAILREKAFKLTQTFREDGTPYLSADWPFLESGSQSSTGSVVLNIEDLEDGWTAK